MEFLEHVVVGSDSPRTHSYIESSGGQTVVWLKGEHDVATVEELSSLLAEAIALAPADVIVDLSGVEFMAVAPVGALLGARFLLQQTARTLVLRSPSRSAQLIFELCGVDSALTPVHAHQVVIATAARALQTFVPVPATAPTAPGLQPGVAQPKAQSHGGRSYSEDTDSKGTDSAGEPVSRAG